MYTNIDYNSLCNPQGKPMPSYRKLQRKNGIYSLSIPPALVKALQAHPGDFFELSIQSDYRITFRHIKQTDAILNLNSELTETQYVRE